MWPTTIQTICVDPKRIIWDILYDWKKLFEYDWDIKCNWIKLNKSKSLSDYPEITDWSLLVLSIDIKRTMEMQCEHDYIWYQYRPIHWYNTLYSMICTKCDHIKHLSK